MKTAELDYPLDEQSIASEPLAERDASRLLCLDRRSGRVEHRLFLELPDLLQPGDVLVRNVSKVVPATLLARRRSGGRVKLLLAERVTLDSYRALARSASRLRAGERLELASGFVIEVLAPADTSGWLQVSASGLDAEVKRSGLPPLPPYIRRPARESDRTRYQTVYAQHPGSVAAPTAGLHFTPAVLARLAARGVTLADVTLHIGPGTFLPLRAEVVAEHHMHAERFEVPGSAVAAIQAARATGGRVVAVGTSALRALETVAREGELRPAAGETDLFVTPGFPFQVVDGLLTNFHQPRSTLLALVAAFAGVEPVLSAYRQAQALAYRFLSYGDAMLIR